jgi:molybdate transport system substrate-binding protein
VAADDLLVFAAASLTEALRELGASYEQTRDDRVAFNFGASSDLARQIAAGAPADAFFSADVARMEELERAGLVERRGRRSVLSNTLVIVVPADATTTISEAADLTNVRSIALANPEAVPAGVYARTYLRSLGLWEALKDRVVPTLDVRAALAAVETGHADAGIVYATDAAISRKVRVAFRVPGERGPPIVYTLAPLKASGKPATCLLVGFLASRDAAPTYERHGFIVLPAE